MTARHSRNVYYFIDVVRVGALPSLCSFLTLGWWGCRVAAGDESGVDGWECVLSTKWEWEWEWDWDGWAGDAL
jgi:hypothetical protein